MIDVVLPCLNEAGALPYVLGRMPDGYRAIVADNGSTDGSGEIAAGLGAIVVREPAPGFGAACWAGLQAAEADVVCFMDCDGSLDPRDLPRVAGPVAAGAADLVLAARDASRGAWPVHVRLANRALAFELRRRTGAGPDRPRPDARRAPHGAAGAGHRGPSLRLAAGDGAARPPGRLAHHRGHGSLPPPRGTLEGHRHRARVRAHRAGHGRGALVTLAVIAKAPVAGRVKTRLTPPCTPEQAAALAEAALRDTLDAVRATPGRAARRRARR